MTTITKKGRELSEKLLPSIGTQELEICSLLARHATSYARIQEGWCNGHFMMGNPNISVQRANKMQERYEKWLDRRETHIENLLDCLVARLPLVNDKPITIKYGGDPRGATVKLIMPDGRNDDWGQEGICVPGS